MSFDLSGPIAESQDDARYPELWDGLRGLWVPAAGVTGAKLFDLSGCNKHATITNASLEAGWTRTNGYTAFDFDGVDDYAAVQISSLVLTDSPGFYLSGWFVPDAIDGNWHTLISKVNTGTTNRQIFLAINDGFSTPTNGLSFFTNQSGSGAVGTSALTAGRLYYFCAMHYSATSGNELWIWSREGGWVQGTSGSAPTSTFIDQDDGTNPVSIGRYVASAALPFSGKILEMHLSIGGRNAPYRMLQSVGPLGIIETRRLEWLYVPQDGGGARRRRIICGSVV